MKSVPLLSTALALTVLGGFGAAAQTFTTSGLERFEAPINGNGDGLGLHQTPIGFLKDDEFNRVRVIGSYSSITAGNLISVSVEGSNNTIQVVADQKNSGNISSEVILNGQLDF